MLKEAKGWTWEPAPMDDLRREKNELAKEADSVQAKYARVKGKRRYRAEQESLEYELNSLSRLFQLLTAEIEERSNQWGLVQTRRGKPEIVALLPESEYERSKKQQLTGPVRLTTISSDETWWWFKDKIYSTTDADLDSDDVVALVTEKETERNRRLQRAHAVTDMTQHLDAKGKREPIAQEVKIAVWRRDGGRCVQCGAQEFLEFDHIIPLHLGGSSSERNLQLLCERCNRSKGAGL